MQPVQPPNTSQQYPILNSLPLQQHMQVVSQQQKVNSPHYHNQPNFIQNPQMQPQSLPPINQAQYLPQQQFINPQPQNMFYTFQPMSPQPQRNVIQSEYNRSA